MKILILDQFAEIGGAQRCLLDLLPEFRERRWHPTALVPALGPYADALVSGGVTIGRIRCGPFRSGSKSIADAVRQATQLRSQARMIANAAANVDLIYMIGPRLLPAIALANIAVPIVYHAHSIVAQRVAAKLAMYSLRRSKAAVIACCRFVGEQWRGATGAASVIYNGVPAATTSSTVRTGPLCRVAVIGRVAPEKGQIEFLRAARLIAPECPHARFEIVGAPLFSASSYFDRVKRESAGLPVEFSGWADNVDEVLARCDLLVVPSSPIDASPRIILEAFASGVPVVSFATGGIPELIEDGRTGVLVRDRSVEALASAILSCIRDQTRRRTLALQAYQRWAESFNVDRYRTEVCDTLAREAARDRQRKPLRTAGQSARA